jgi:hypothetical protein
MKYRIKEVTKNRISKYYIQRKFLFWWISDDHCWYSYIQASEAIASEVAKVSIKYHEVDINNLGLNKKIIYILLFLIIILLVGVIILTNVKNGFNLELNVSESTNIGLRNLKLEKEFANLKQKIEEEKLGGK